VIVRVSNACMHAACVFSSYVRTYACMYVCTYVNMHACTHVCVCISYAPYVCVLYSRPSPNRFLISKADTYASST
jgi:hypothetical protein